MKKELALGHNIRVLKAQECLMITLAHVTKQRVSNDLTLTHNLGKEIELRPRERRALCATHLEATQM